MTTRLGDIAAELHRLADDERLARLETRQARFSLMQALGLSRAEVPHSRLLSRALSPGQHTHGELVLRTFLSGLQGPLNQDRPQLAREIGAVAASPWSRVRVRREYRRIDVVLDIVSEAGHLAVGIENKIDAGEQENQVARYQEAMKRAFPEARSLVVFLTPSGYASSTVDESHPVPAFAVAYEAVVRALEVVEEQGPSATSVAGLRELSQHLREEIVGHDESRRLVAQLWEAYPKALGEVLRLRPRLKDIQQAYIAALRRHFPGDVDYVLWPEKGAPREVKLVLKSWAERKFPFRFMLYEGPFGPKVRVLLHRDHFRADSARFKSWAKEVNSVEPGLLDEGFAALPGWTVWRRVLKEEDDPEDSNLENVAYDQRTVEEAIERIANLVAILEPHTTGIVG